jgi:hypothetical protein
MASSNDDNEIENRVDLMGTMDDSTGDDSTGDDASLFSIDFYSSPKTGPNTSRRYEDIFFPPMNETPTGSGADASAVQLPSLNIPTCTKRAFRNRNLPKRYGYEDRSDLQPQHKPDQQRRIRWGHSKSANRKKARAKMASPPQVEYPSPCWPIGTLVRKVVSVLVGASACSFLQPPASTSHLVSFSRI